MDPNHDLYWAILYWLDIGYQWSRHGAILLLHINKGSVCLHIIRISINRDSVRFRQFTDPDPVFADLDPARAVDTY